MNNQVHGLCTKCIEKFNPDPPPAINYQCQKCSQNQAQLIVNDSVVCVKCYIKLKESSSMLKRSQIKNSNLLTLVSKSQLNASILGSFLNRNGKVIKKLQKIFTSCDLKSNAIVLEINKKSILSGGLKQPIQWQKIVDKCHKTSPLIFFFVGKQIIFGAFHTEPVKISSGEGSILEDMESGLFMTQRAKYDLNIYKTLKSIVRYSNKTKSIIFGDPCAFEISFTSKEILIKSEFAESLKWQNFFICKV